MINKITLDAYIFKSKDEALKEAIAINLKNDSHPSFDLYKTGKMKCKLIAKLVRDFGKEDLYWKNL